MGINFGSLSFASPSTTSPATATATATDAAHALVARVHDVRGATVLEHSLPLGLSPEQEAARWQAALQAMPTVYDGAAVLHGPALLGGLLVGAGAAALLARVLIRRERSARRKAKQE